MVAPRHIALLCTLLFAGNAWASCVSDKPTTSPRLNALLSYAPALPLQLGQSPPRPAPRDSRLLLALPGAGVDISAWLDRAADFVSATAPAAFDLTLEPVSRPIGPVTLFSPDAGLQGITQQQWVTKRFGFTTGVGINLNEPPDREADEFKITELPEKLLIGAGFMIAF